MTEEVNYHLDHLAANDIPITMYHFDGQAWSASETCDFSLGDPLRDRLAGSGLRALLHNWGGCYGVADFDHVYGQLGHTLAGFYLDDDSTDALAKTATDWAQSKMPGDSEVVMKGYKGYQTDPSETAAGLTMYGHSCYVNDQPSDFGGMKEGIRRMLSLADILPAPFNEFTGYSGDRPDEETFYRRIHFGAMQVVMDHSPDQNASPWNTSYYGRRAPRAGRVRGPVAADPLPRRARDLGSHIGVDLRPVRGRRRRRRHRRRRERKRRQRREDRRLVLRRDQPAPDREGVPVARRAS